MTVAYRRGATLVNNVSVQDVSARRAEVIIRTSSGAIAARKAVMATDAMLAPATPPRDPWVERAITVAIQTHPIPSQALPGIGLAPHTAFYTDDMPLLWGRVMPDLSLLVGRELVPGRLDAPAGILSSVVASSGALLLERARRLHPALAGLTLKRAWGGPIASTKTGQPAVVPDRGVPGLFWAGGYGGQGIAQSFRVSQLAAEALERPGA
jgi:taurine dioxygenase/taurine dehydrogenase large subunit